MTKDEKARLGLDVCSGGRYSISGWKCEACPYEGETDAATGMECRDKLIMDMRETVCALLDEAKCKAKYAEAAARDALKAGMKLGTVVRRKERE